MNVQEAIEQTRSLCRQFGDSDDWKAFRTMEQHIQTQDATITSLRADADALREITERQREEIAALSQKYTALSLSESTLRAENEVYEAAMEQATAQVAALREQVEQRDRAIRILSEWLYETGCCVIPTDFGCSSKKDCVDCAINAALEVAKEGRHGNTD